MKRFEFKKAFTLAEVLITLAILGIIAAITIPNIVKQYNRKVTVTKVLRFYSDLSKIYDIYLASNTEPSVYPTTTTASTEIFNNLIKPNLKIKKDCGTGKKKKECLYDGKYTQHGADWADFVSTEKNSNNGYGVEFKDGSTLYLFGYEKYNSGGTRISAAFHYDVNGKKGPNAYGIDDFLFFIIDKRIIPAGSYEKCKGNLAGSDCTKWIIMYKNQNYLDCKNGVDYAKGQCK